jgi:hypothetical protein
MYKLFSDSPLVAYRVEASITVVAPSGEGLIWIFDLFSLICPEKKL